MLDYRHGVFGLFNLGLLLCYFLLPVVNIGLVFCPLPNRRLDLVLEKECPFSVKVSESSTNETHSDSLPFIRKVIDLVLNFLLLLDKIILNLIQLGLGGSKCIILLEENDLLRFRVLQAARVDSMSLRKRHTYLQRLLNSRELSRQCIIHLVLKIAGNNFRSMILLISSSFLGLRTS